MIRTALALFVGAGALSGREPPEPAPPEPAPGERVPVGASRVDERTSLAHYDPETLAGFTVLFHRDLDGDLTRRRRVRAALLFDLETLSARVPASALGALRSVRFLVTPSLDARPGLSGRGMCFHPSPQWLESAGFERERAGTVEICNADDFLQWRAEQPMMVLHELSHAYHCMIGFERADVRGAFEHAVAGGAYERVRHALRGPDETQRAYAATNEREYFAELSEAWFGRNDMEPFTRDDLRGFDPQGAVLVERLWTLSPDDLDRERRAAAPAPPGALGVRSSEDR